MYNIQIDTKEELALLFALIRNDEHLREEIRLLSKDAQKLQAALDANKEKE